jgi:hypothetical protein
MVSLRPAHAFDVARPSIAGRGDRFAQPQRGNAISSSMVIAAPSAAGILQKKPAGFPAGEPMDL